MIGKSFSSQIASAQGTPGSPASQSASRDTDLVGIEELSADIGHRHLFFLERFQSICERVFFRTRHFEPVKLSES